MRSTFLFLSAGAIVIGLMIGVGYLGDACIYLVYAKNLWNGWWGLNPGEFSSGATSPLWAIILAPLFAFPNPQTLAPILSGAFLFAGMVSGSKLMPDRVGELLLAVVLYFALVPTLLIFETGLMVFVCFELLRGKTWAALALPLVRPEGVLIVLAFGLMDRRYLWGLVPVGLYWLLSHVLTGAVSTSAVYRLEDVIQNPNNHLWNLKRYAIITLPFLSYWIHDFIARHFGVGGSPGVGKQAV